MTTKEITTKAELLSAIAENWMTLQAALIKLSAAQLTTIHDAQGWSVKDHINHMLYWERSVLFFLQGKARHAGLDVDEAIYLTDDEDEINNAIFQKHKDLPLTEALARFGEVHQQLVTELQPLSDADLQKRYRAYLPDEPGKGDGPPALNVVYGNSAHHFAEHLAWIEALATAGSRVQSSRVSGSMQSEPLNLKPETMEPETIKQAVYNNAVWCDTVCSAHGWPGEFHDEIWVQRRGSLPGYPNAVTLTDAHDVMTQHQSIQRLVEAGLPDGWCVKDSFCTLDLTPLGFQPLFEATWLYRPADRARPVDGIEGVRWSRVQNATELIAWERAWRGAPGEETGEEPPRLFVPALLADDQVVMLAAYQAEGIVAGVILNRTGAVVGLSNLFAPDTDGASWWASCVAAACDHFPGLPLVGYERGEDRVHAQQSGFEALGPLRIWIKTSNII